MGRQEICFILEGLKNNIIIYDIDIHVDDINSRLGYIYTKGGSWREFTTNEGAWTETGAVFPVLGQGLGNPTSLPPNAFAPISVYSVGETQGIYITLALPVIKYTFMGGQVRIFARDSNLHIWKGVGKGLKFVQKEFHETWLVCNDAMRDFIA